MPKGQMYSKSIPIARFSFWNLVGLGESSSESKGEGTHRDNISNEVVKDSYISHIAEGDAHEEEEPETYKRLCYL